MSGEHHEVGGDHRAPRVRAKRSVRTPRAAIPAEAALEERDDAFDAGSEMPQALIEPGAFDHLLDGQAGRLAECHITDPERLDCAEIFARAEAAIEDDLLRGVAEHLDRAFRKLHGLRRIGRVATLYARRPARTTATDRGLDQQADRGSV